MGASSMPLLTAALSSQTPGRGGNVLHPSHHHHPAHPAMLWHGAECQGQSSGNRGARAGDPLLPHNPSSITASHSGLSAAPWDPAVLLKQGYRFSCGKEKLETKGLCWKNTYKKSRGGDELKAPHPQVNSGKSGHRALERLCFQKVLFFCCF